MRGKTWVLALLATGLVVWFGRGAFSEDEKAPEGMDPAAMEKMMEELAKPGENHAWLAKFDGTWDITGEFNEMDGSKHAITGTATSKMVLGGRYSESTFSGTYRGKPMEGKSLTGYDNMRKQYVNYWFDTMSTYTAPASGSRGGDGKTLVLEGTWEMPGVSTPFKYVYTWVSENSFTFDMVMSHEGHEMPVGKMTYTRK